MGKRMIPGLDRCSLPCRRPHLQPSDYTAARWLTGTSAAVCIVVNLIAIVSQFAPYSSILGLFSI
ncbi:unnamed protein product [Protopolystoma xenopodis]|uniref:Uncharacterized protein n=1 Tax=Protopolystoma xenopodis TaxID=117903 RepID=A0A448WNC1_9PLAT|nr:unnamed protein product [Protopolystoma xenopodis]